MEIVAILIGLLLRLGAPIGVMALLAWWLKRLDARWQREAEAARASRRLPAAGPPCWDQRGCPPERRSVCPAFLRPEEPCWQHFRATDGQLRESCLVCQVFRNFVPPAPQPA